MAHPLCKHKSVDRVCWGVWYAVAADGIELSACVYVVRCVDSHMLVETCMYTGMFRSDYAGKTRLNLDVLEWPRHLVCCFAGCSWLCAACGMC